MKDMRSKMQYTSIPDPSMREKMMKERAEKQSQIDAQIRQIEEALNKNQLEKFKFIEKLKLINKSGQMKSK